MAKRSRKNISKVIAIIASLVLALGLLPVTASAAGEGPDNAGGQAPDAPQAVAAAGPEAPPASPGKAGDGAAEGGKAVEGGAQDGAGASGNKSGETGDGKAGAPTDGAAEGAPGAAPADAGGAEGKGGPAGQAGNPGKAGGPETAAPAAGNGAAAANVQTAQPAAEPAGARAQLPAFRQSKTVGGVTVTVEAGAGAFPEGAGLSVASVPSSATEAAVAGERGAGENVAASYTFDIKVLGADGAELQPAGGGSVRVSFRAAEVADPNLDVSVYHVSGGEAEELAVSESGSTATAQSDGFSYYTVEFTYGELRYVLPGGESVPLADVLAAVGLEGEPTAATSSDPDLFGVEMRDGAWTVSARQAFTSAEALTVTINGQNYEIAVTDEQAVDGGDCGDGVTWELTGQGDDLTLTISYTGGGSGDMSYYNYNHPPWYGYRESITTVIIGEGVTSIGDHAFAKCTSLTSASISSSVKFIFDSAFESCTSLESVSISDSVEYIGKSVFIECASLESVSIPGSVMSVEEWAFCSCSGLKSVTIASDSTDVSTNAFSECESLKDVYYGGTPLEWQEKCMPAFQSSSTQGDDPTVHFACGDGVYYTCDVDGKNLIISKIGEGTDAIIDGDAFDTLLTSSIETAVIEYGVTSVGTSAFAQCASLESVMIPESVTSIGAMAFFDCRGLSEIYYGGSEAQWRQVEKGNDWDEGTSPYAITYAKWDVTASVNPSEGGMVTGSGVYAKDPAETVTLEAAPNDGYRFVGWSKKGDDAIVSSDAKYEFKATENAEYVAHFKIPLTITAKDAKLPYNGQKQGPGDIVYEDGLSVVVSGLKGDDKLTAITVDGQGDAAGTYDLVPSAAAIGENGKLTDNYEITYVTGTLTIEPAKATVTTGSATKVYDGTPLTKAEASITGLVNGETATATATGSQTEVGSSPNTCSIEWGTADPKNYAVTERLGTLTVEAAPARKGTLTFDLAGGTLDGKTGSITVEADVGDTVKLPGAPTKKGYAFKFWKGSEYAAGAEYKVEGDHAFTAEWAAVHTVTFDANGHGKAPDAQTVEHGKKAKKPANPTADGYTFGGWYKDEACKEAYDFSKPVTADLTLYAKWTKKSSSGSGTSPKTGDPLAGVFAVALALAAASALALALSRRRSRG